jgi:hypothetical protein
MIADSTAAIMMPATTGANSRFVTSNSTCSSASCPPYSARAARPTVSIPA